MISTEKLAKIYDRNLFDGEPSSDAKKPWRYRARKFEEFDVFYKTGWGIFDEKELRFLDFDDDDIDADEMLPEA